MSGVSTAAGGVVSGGPKGGVPVVVAVFATWPASMSAWVSRYAAVAVADCPGSSVPATPGQL